MNTKVLKSLIVSSLLLFSLALPVGSRPVARGFAPPAPLGDLMAFVPQSDALMLVDVRRLLNETLPRIFGGDAAKLAQVNADVDKLKARTGIDARSFDRVVVGVRFTYPSPTVTRTETIAIARGTFNSKALLTAGRIAANGKYREEQHRGSTIMIFSINDQIKMLGLWDVKVTDLAACALDANTLALGNLAAVRAAIDAGKLSQRPNTDLATLAGRDPKAVIGFGANLPAALLKSLDVGNDTIAKDVNSIRQVWGSVGTTETDVAVLLAARTDSAESGKNLGETVEGLKQLGGILIMRMAPAKKALAQTALDNLKITTRGAEVEIQTQVAASSLASLVK